MVRHSFPRYVCSKCNATFHKFSLPRRKYGAALCAYVLYQTIEMQLSQRAVGKSLQQMFSIPASGNLINRLKASAALRYEDTYKALLKKIVSGTLVHADETRTNLILKQGYVWVFTNHEEGVLVVIGSDTRLKSTISISQIPGRRPLLRGENGLDSAAQRLARLREKTR